VEKRLKRRFTRAHRDIAHKKTPDPNSSGVSRDCGYPAGIKLLLFGAATAEALVEAIHPATGIQDLLLAGEEGVAL
jgi:hypothetical protein